MVKGQEANILKSRGQAHDFRQVKRSSKEIGGQES